MDELLSRPLLDLRGLAAEVTRDAIAPHSARVDAECLWPRHSLDALAAAGLLGLHVPLRLGGHEQGLLALAVVSETIARGCPSSALCFAMHSVGTAVITAKATPHHEERYLAPIADGRHLTTLALSEAGTGAHFYFPQTRLERDDGSYAVVGAKQFVTNGGHADSYVISTLASGRSQPGEFSCLVVDAGAEGVSWHDPWRGFGMRGNSSGTMRLDGARVPHQNLLGHEGDQIWYVFEVVAPYFLMGMAGTYVGIAQAALDATLARLRTRTYAHSGETLADVTVLQHRAAGMAAAVQRTRGLVYHAAYLGDVGDPKAVPEIMLAKAEAAEVAVAVANEAMTCCGGHAYRENSLVSRLLRDARAGHVMAPTTDILRTWAGRLLLDRPLF